MKGEKMSVTLFRCPYCNWVGSREYFEVEHIIPVSRTVYANTGSNLQLVCSGCNRQKGDKTDAEYKLWRLLNPKEANRGPIKD